MSFSIQLSSAKSKLVAGIFLQAILITHHHNHEMAHVIKSFLTKNQNIPESFIVIKKSSDACRPQKSFMHFCLDENDEFKILKFDQARVQEIFGRYKN